MRNLLVAACCAALIGSIPVASAETAGTSTRDSVKSHNPLDSYAQTEKKSTKKKKSTKSGDTSKDSMSNMSKDSMQKDSTSK